MNKNELDKCLISILQILQAKPLAYRSFGIYWWPIKAILKQKYTKENLYLLGDYVDPDGVERVPDVGVSEMIKQAFSEFQMNTSFGFDGNQVTDTEGEPYTIFDQDADI